MDKLESNQQSKILFKHLNRENLYNLFIYNNTTHINITELNKLSKNKKVNEPKYKVEKLILLNLMMNNHLDSLFKNITDIKFDYIIGFLIYLTNNPQFKYSLGYFIDHKETFNKILKTWNVFLNTIISDINSLPNIDLQQHIIIEYEGILNFTIVEDSIIKVEIKTDDFSQLFKIRDKTYYFSIKIDNVIITTGKSDGNGKDSTLYKAITELNKLITGLSINNNQLISLMHEN